MLTVSPRRRRSRNRKSGVATIWRTHDRAPFQAFIVTSSDAKFSPVAMVEFSEGSREAAIRVARWIRRSHDRAAQAARMEYRTPRVTDIRGRGLDALPDRLLGLHLFPVTNDGCEVRHDTFRALVYRRERVLGPIAKLMTHGQFDSLDDEPQQPLPAPARAPEASRRPQFAA